MQLGAMPLVNSGKPKEIGATDIDTAALDNRLKNIEKQQMYILIAIAITLFLILYKK
jgi:hypothetical protein